MTTDANDLLNRAKQEYVEMPGLVLTIRQASRLWNLDTAVCQALLSALVLEEFVPDARRRLPPSRQRGFARSSRRAGRAISWTPMIDAA